MSNLLFPYELPETRIAQRPAAPGASRLLHARCRAGQAVEIIDREFAEISSLLTAGDLLVVNNTKVLPARFFPREIADNAEVLLVQRLSGDAQLQRWFALARPMRKCEKAKVFQLSPSLRASCCGRSEAGEYLCLEIASVRPELSVDAAIEAEGVMPIPPYIRQGHADQEDAARYQTVFASQLGSVAAPTAGLHFTPGVLAELQECGVSVAFVTHHVGPASFLPVRDGDWANHTMSSEHYQFSEAAYGAVALAKQEGRRVVAVGTTSVRALESFFTLDEPEREARVASLQATSLYITPGYTFKAVDALITNFHQPLSTHLLLVAAFIGVDACESIYRHGLAGDYRFLSYGDGMLLEREE